MSETQEAHVERPMTRFQRVILGLALLLHLPWVFWLAHGVDRRMNLPTLIETMLLTALLALSMVLFWGRAKWVMDDVPREPWLVRLIDLPYFVHLAALVLAFVPALIGSVLLILHLVPASALGWIYGGCYALAAYGVLWRRLHFVVREGDVTMPGLPAELDGLRVAHLSDLHLGGMLSRARALRWIDATHAAKPDLVVLTGDYVTSGVAFHEDITYVIGELRAPLGVFASLGNHDYFGGGEPMITLLRERGVRVLRNQGVAIERGGGSMYLAATDDVWTQRADLDQTLAGWDPQKMPCLLLAHDPDLFVPAAQRGVQLTLSGHTHGGQLAIPFFARWLSLSHFAHRFHLGFYRRDAATLYVSPGLGTTGLPLRIGTTPTIAIHVLRA